MENSIGEGMREGPRDEDARFVQKELSTPTPGPAGRGAVSPSDLPSDVLEDAARRLGTLALIYSVTFFVAALASHFLIVRFGPQNWGVNHPIQLGVAVLAVLMGLGVFWLSRSGRMSAQALLDFGLVFEVVGALAISVSEYWGMFSPADVQQWSSDAVYLGIPWECVWIVLFPLIAPNTPLKTVAASLGAASTGLLTIAVSKAVGATAADVPMSFFAVYFLFSTYICAGIGIAGNRFMLTLGSRLKKARDVGSYQLCEPLGKGGMGQVWRAEHRMLARPAAIKLIRRENCGDDPRTCETVMARFEREARATATLKSCHTIELYDFGRTEEGAFYYVMELLDGLDMGTFVERFGPVPPARVVHFLKQACHSLHDAHAQGLIHRDVKPANIFVCRLGQDVDFVKVLDFGLVKPSEDGGGREATQLTQEGLAAGTPSYMAPEAAMGKGLDARADIYALGCVGYWLLTGEQLFDGDTPMQVVLKHVQEEPVRPSLRTEIELPEGLEEVIMSCLRKSPDDRPPTGAELADRLERCIPEDQRWTGEDAKEWWRVHLPERLV